MTLAVFFEGTGQGVDGEFTNVTRLHDLCVEDDRQHRLLVSGPGTVAGLYVSGSLAGADWRILFRRARRWFEAHYRTLPPGGIGTTVQVFGFSRGALIARHFCAWLDTLGVAVAYLGVWDTVDATAGLDVSATLPGNVARARHAVARDEERKFYDYVPLDADDGRVEEVLFPGSHSDVGGYYADNHVIADVALSWIAEGACASGLRLTQPVPEPDGDAVAAAAVHDSYREASNLWGAFDRLRRRVRQLPLHRAFANFPPGRQSMR